MNQRAGIYIHIPFCETRCHYCNFATGGYESEVARRYVAAVRSEIERAEIKTGCAKLIRFTLAEARRRR